MDQQTNILVIDLQQVRKIKKFFKRDHSNRDINVREPKVFHLSFSLKNEISKIKSPVPFNELLKNVEYKIHISRIIKGENHQQWDPLELHDDVSTIVFGPNIEYIE